MPDTIERIQDDRSTLTEARAKVEELRLWVETELDRAKVGTRADDELESLHQELENRRSLLNFALGELEDELGAMDDGTNELRRDYQSNLGLSVGRAAAE